MTNSAFSQSNLGGHDGLTGAKKLDCGTQAFPGRTHYQPFKALNSMVNQINRREIKQADKALNASDLKLNEAHNSYLIWRGSAFERHFPCHISFSFQTTAFKRNRKLWHLIARSTSIQPLIGQQQLVSRQLEDGMIGV